MSSIDDDVAAAVAAYKIRLEKLREGVPPLSKEQIAALLAPEPQPFPSKRGKRA